MRVRKTDPDTPYKKWLCYLLASVANEDAELPPQHDDAFRLIGKQLGLGEKSVAGYSSKARKQLATAAGELEYHDWLNKREVSWWLYHVLYLEKRELKSFGDYVSKVNGDTFYIIRRDVQLTRKEIEARVTEAKELRSKNKRGEHDYQAWFGVYKRRDVSAQGSPVLYRPLPDDDPAAIGLEKRTQNG
jgi:hypothetical protein